MKKDKWIHLFGDLESYGLKWVLLQEIKKRNIKDGLLVSLIKHNLNYLYQIYEKEYINDLLKSSDVKSYANLIKSDKENYFNFDIDLEKHIKKLIFDIYETDDWKNVKIWYHNGSGFDFHFILSVLFDNYKFFKNYFEKKGYFFLLKPLYVKNKDIYKITITIFNERKIKKEIVFSDTLLLFRTTLKSLGEAIGQKKLEVEDYDIIKDFKNNEDYFTFNNGDDWNYLKRDVDILEKFFDYDIGVEKNDLKLTVSSTAVAQFKKINDKFINMENWINVKQWVKLKPAHRGGFTWVNPDFQLKEVKNIFTYDINSAYAGVMKFFKIPYGRPSFKPNLFYTYEFFNVEIEYAKTEDVPFFEDENLDNQIKKYNQLQKDIKSGVEIDRNYLNDLNIKKYPKRLIKQTLLMDKYQLDYFEQHYTGVWKKEFVMSFKETKGVFDDFIKFWEELKTKYTLENNKVGRLFAKQSPVTVPGKAGQTPFEDVTAIYQLNQLDDMLLLINENVKENGYYFKKVVIGKNLYIDKLSDKNVLIKRNKVLPVGNKYIKVSLWESESERISFIPLAISVLSQARVQLFEVLNKYKDYLIYVDTDSCHLLNKKIDNKYIHPTKFGLWKFEGRTEKAIFRRPKHYLKINTYDENDNLVSDYELKGGGFNVKKANNEKLVDFETYKKEEFLMNGGKIAKIRFAHGIILYETDYKFTMPKDFKKGGD